MKLDEFCAHYDGDALSDNEMDVSALGPALLAFGEITRIAYREVDPLSGKQPTVKVQQFSPGSFEILMGIDLNTVEEVVDLFTNRYSSAAANVVGIGGGLMSLITAAIYALKRLTQGKNATRDELIDQLGDELLAEHVRKLQKHRQFRENVKKVVKPLTREGIAELTLKDREGKILVSIDENEAEGILDLESDARSAVRYEDAIITIGTPQMEKPLKLKWRLEHPEYGSITASLQDEDFAVDVLNGSVRFYRGSKFKTKLRVEEETDATGQVIARSFEIVQIEQEGEEYPTLDLQ
ncbi:hypothetical protein QP866_02515 [Corynebacterium imitans]|uniref:hypothetical protein n=1 Tax=Corynebacterium imitans TaxID=156978 RepID=UPI0025514267|nr:hypothetical protein [Corynebacterium imitans]MDK8305835.1 hypothetical protein [Corynebacterium imitans]MDK8636699.1 hypothetical protein [Corynebacterium imitans]MDK8772314.1 hypothetical protein [Corynebacterium imitans]